ncbi:MAG: M36 family metallopeptidase [Planctomycetota bacterium]|nr:M36 family metallopeptidase [Planctomycetota bacterium]
MHNGSSSRKLVVAALVLAAGSSMALAAAVTHNGQPCEQCNSGLPFFDIRLDTMQRTTRAAAEPIAAIRLSQSGTARAAAIAQLAARVPGLRVDDDAHLGTPQFIRSPETFLTAASVKAPKDIVFSFANEFAALLEVDGTTLASYPVTRDYSTGDGLMRHLTWQQQINGLDLFGAELRANVSGKGELMNVGSTIIPVPEDGTGIPAASLNEQDALRFAATNVGITMTAQPAATTQVGPHGGTIYQGTADFGNQDPIEIRSVYFARTRELIVPAFWVSVPERGVGNTYDMVVDATNGDILWRHNRLVWETTQPATYRVYTGDSPAPGSPGRNTPDGVQFPFVARTLRTVTPAEVSPFSPNGWIPDGATTTVGNNTDTYLDAANDNTASAADRATGVSRVFDFAMNVGLNTGDAPTAYQQASITQLFYYTNMFHDRLYALGFNEASGNFQTSNFAAGGTGNDPVRSESQDGSGTNNANFSTSGTDGSTARCQMYIFTGPTPDRDGSFDGDIVYHEMAHGLSIRLHRGGLTGTQGGGMGEGWSDFFGLCLNAQNGDDFAAVYGAGAFATYNITAGFTNNYYYGIRRYPYSPDFNKSPLTFADVDNGQFSVSGSVPRGPIGSATANEVHNTGEIWCNTLLEMRRELALTEGFAANQIAMQLAVDGMKLAPGTPDFLDERDAILQADLNRYGGVHQSAIWTAFAKRGMGFSATSPAGGGTAGVVEAFDIPQRVAFSYPDGLPTTLSPDSPTNFRVTLTPSLLTLTPGSQVLWYSVNGGGFTQASLSLISGTTYQASIPAEPCFSNVRFYIETGTSAGGRTDPISGAAAAYSGTVQTGEVTIFSDDMETNRGWTVSAADTAISGRWERADPQATTVQSGDDHTPGTGVNCWVTGAAAGASVGANDVDGGATTLISPTFNLSTASGAEISYWRWYTNTGGAAPNADTFRVDLSNDNGSTWTNFETVGPSGDGTSGGWVNFSRRVSDVLPLTATMRVRFVAEDAGAGSLVEAMVDDFTISTALCERTFCAADFNQDGGVDQADVDAFFAAWENGQAAADVNADGGVDGDDVSAFFSVWENGGC